MTGTTNVPQLTYGPTGFIPPAAPLVLGGVQADISAAFGTVLNYNLNTPQGQLSSSWAANVVAANSAITWLTQQFDPAYAQGRFQDAIGRYYFIVRQPATATTLQVLCNGAGVTIPLGATIQDPAGNIYANTAAGTIGVGGGTITLAFACTVLGPIAIPATISIYQAIPGWDTVALTTGSTQGVAVEGSGAFESRRAASVAQNSFGPIGAIIGAVASVPGVTDFFGYANATAGSVTVGGVSIAANAIYICAVGGTNAAVAAAIFSKKSPGAPMVGNTTVTVADNNPLYTAPQNYNILFQRPTNLQIVFHVTIANNANVPSNAIAQVQNAIINAFNGNPSACVCTAAISGFAMVITAVTSGTPAYGQIVYGPGVAPGTTITSLTAGATSGTYNATVSVSQNLASTTLTMGVVNAPGRARINSVIYATGYAPPVAALGTWALVTAIGVSSANTPDAVITGHIVGTTLTVVTTLSGTVATGQFLFDPQGLILSGTTITGPLGGGQWSVSQTQTVSGATFTGTGSGTNLTVASITGTLNIGDVIAGTGVPTGTTILSQTSGPTGGNGTYVTSGTTTASGAACTANRPITLVSGDQSLVSVGANQEPQITANNIVLLLQ